MEKWIDAPDGAKLFALIEGSETGEAVVLSHSLGGDLHQWDSLAAALSGRYRVIRYDSRGHGRSDAPDAPYSVEMLGRDALAVMDALGVENCVFVGLSKGGMTGQWLGANASGRLSALVLANTTSFIPMKEMWDRNVAMARADGLCALARPTLERWFCRAFQDARPDVVAKHVAVMEAMPVAGYAGSCAVLRDVDLRDSLKRIVAPALVIAGGEEVPPMHAAAHALAEAIPNSRECAIPYAGHLSPIENPEAFNRAVVRFLADAAN